MPEYRRFIAYFYEYADGKKQKNAGYAKVELRNGVWRLSLRLTVGVWPEQPIQVLGFVRRGESLQGFPIGTMQTGRELFGEWTFRADAPVGESGYRLEELAGMQVESADGRQFLTVWDDGAVDPGKIVPGTPREEPVMRAPEEQQEIEADEEAPEEPVIRAPEEQHESEADEEAPEEPVMRVPEEQQEIEADEEASEEPVMRAPQEQQESGASDEVPEEQQEIEADEEAPEETHAPAFVAASENPCPEPECTAGRSIEHLFRSRQRFWPFEDAEIVNCVKIMPCDIVRLQQENWQVGKSNFLYHGFYQYRHLLLGTTCDGTYILGVPGVHNPHEQYMAQMFGFARFKPSGQCGRGATFGYWYRDLKQCE